MSQQRGLAVWALFLFAGIFLVIYFPAEDLFFRLVIDLLVLPAVGILFLSVREWFSPTTAMAQPAPSMTPCPGPVVTGSPNGSGPAPYTPRTRFPVRAPRSITCGRNACRPIS
ncbi:hypothetical protein ABZZ79_15620 [Streptomyces sp. NPDC006458]|uniref:hypothetical protein n=1 Tax=Streptomyces sp. NPDC006458 TaxID=3154302 RepID=UPI0033AA761C